MFRKTASKARKFVETPDLATQANFESDERKTREQTFQDVLSLLLFEKLGLQSTEDDSVDEEEENRAHTMNLKRERTYI